MAIFQKNDGGIMDVIRCDESDYLIWKWHPKGSTLSASKKTNSIRWGSSLRVKEGSVAVFVYPQEDGTLEEFIEGPYDGIIDTKNFPVLTNLLGVLYNGDSPFQAEVYFINTRQLIQIKFGVPYFDVFDSRFMDYGVPVAVRGSINFNIDDYRHFIKLHGLGVFEMGTFKSQVKDAIIRLVKKTITNTPDRTGIPLVQIERKIMDVNELVEMDLQEALYNDYGVTVTRVDISAIEIDKSSDGYKKLQKLTQNKASVFTHAAVNIVDTVSVHRAGAKKMKKQAKEALKDDSSGGIDVSAVGKKMSGAISGALGSLKKAGKGENDPVSTLKQFKELLDSGIITQEEFDAKKKEILG